MFAEPTRMPVCVVVGVGPGNGAAFARRSPRRAMPSRFWPVAPASPTDWRTNSPWRAPMLAMWAIRPRWNGSSLRSNPISDLLMSSFTMRAKRFGAPPKR